MDLCATRNCAFRDDGKCKDGNKPCPAAPCPFCGEKPDIVDTNTVIHTPSRICALSNLVFKLSQWNNRV